MTEIRITVTNTSSTGGTFLTPFWFGAHDEGFDLFEIGDAASPGLEAIAEDGTFGAIADELLAADPEAQGGAVFGAGGPIATGETASANLMLEDEGSRFLSLAAMILPSNDAFIGTTEEVELIDAEGNFLGTQMLTFLGEDVYDAGTEVNTEMDAAFINQMGPNTGETEGGVITRHPGFIGSEGNPDGTPIILGGTNAAGAFIDPIAADFTREGAQIATITIEEVIAIEGTAGNDALTADGSVLQSVDGGDGTDSLTIDAAFDTLTISRIEGGFRIGSDEARDIDVRNVETITLSDQTLTLDNSESAATIFLLYQTVFGVDPDIEGHSFWNDAAVAGTGLGEISGAFAEVSDFDMSDSISFVGGLYDAALGREGDDEGVTFWSGLLDSGAADEGDVLLAFATAEEAQDLNAEALADGFLLFA